MSRPRISIIIVSWNSRKYLEYCLKSVITQEEVPIDVIVVDNASEDGTQEYIREYFPSVKLICNHENIGFARANNQAILINNNPYLLLLNSDTIMAQNTIAQMEEYMERNLLVGAIGPCLLNLDKTIQSSIRKYPKLVSAITDNLPEIGIKQQLQEEILRYRNVAGNVEAVSGACIFVRRDVVDAIGPLDEDFFFYVEDLDWCYRIREIGYQVHYVPWIEVMHFGGGSSVGDNFVYELKLLSARLLYVQKHYNGFINFVYRLILSFSLIIRSIYVYFVAKSKTEDRSRSKAYCKYALKILVSLNSENIGTRINRIGI